MAAVKILVAGDTKGKFKELFDRVAAVNKKNGPFELLLCVGDFFPETYSSDVVVPPAPITTYVLGPTKTSQVNYFSNLTGCELAENVTYLGKKSFWLALKLMENARLKKFSCNLIGFMTFCRTTRSLQRQ